MLRRHAPDRELLELFVRRRDETAFEALVKRHGPMVWGVCCRILGNAHDADDAFQATFLVLVKKASSVRAATVGNWLYGVAYRTALEARHAAMKRRQKEANVLPRTESADHRWSEVGEVLDHELSRMPDKYRAAIVLCDVEGKSRKEVAVELGLAEGTVASRLSRGRVMLAERLARRGVTLSGGALAAVITEHAASASAPAAVVTTAVMGALGKSMVPAKVTTLVKGVLNVMFLSKLKSAIPVVLTVVALGLGGAVYQSVAEERCPAQPPGRPATALKHLQDAIEHALQEETAQGRLPDAVLDRVARVHVDSYHVKGWSNNCMSCHRSDGGAGPGFDTRKLLESIDLPQRKAILKSITVRAVTREIERAIAQQRHYLPDRQTEMEALDEIGKTLKTLKEQARKRTK
jgi:RNA polymerase sigma factor (sigma-70 family)